jgi:hypothetical protein
MPTTVTNILIAEWRRSRPHHRRIAAHIALWASGKPAGTAVPDNSAIAADLDFLTTGSAINRAKELLADHGFLTGDRNGYRLAGSL